MICVRRAAAGDQWAIFEMAKLLATSYEIGEVAFGVTFASLWAQANAHLLVAELNGDPVGYLLGYDHRCFYANGLVGWVEELYVSESARRLGIGNQLMLAFENTQRERGSCLVGLATRRAKAFYEAIGYEDSATYFKKRIGPTEA